MARRQPHPLALFSLLPLNDRAHAVIKHADNSHLVSTLTERTGEQVFAIDVGFHITSTARTTLATLGRSGADITVEGSSISRTQCSFEIGQDFGSVMLYDRSNSQTTQVFGENRVPFEPGRVRRIAVADHLNTILGMGGAAFDLVQFKMVWHQRALDSKELVTSRVDNPRLARTVDEAPTAAPSARVTRIHTPSDRDLKLRYAKMGVLGRGQFGEVLRAVDVDSGRVMAVKVMKRPALGFENGLCRLFLCANLTKHSQQHIVEYIGTQGTGEHLEIFMALQDGSVEDLIRQDLFRQESAYYPADSLLHHVLIGIDYLNHVKVVHRDVKPANILFTKISDAEIRFQIADFGLCNFTDNARTYTGSPLFMAPEVLRNDGSCQTSKVDVWSLFVTMAYVMNVDGYRKKCLRTNAQIINSVLEVAGMPLLSPLKEMANLDPDKRASAASMLHKLFKGEGLTTPLDQIQDRSPRRKAKPDSEYPQIPAVKVVNPSSNRPKPLPTPKSRVRLAGITKDSGEKTLGHVARATKLNEKRRMVLHIPGMFPKDP